MERTPEPELMDDPAQALAYAQADFSEPHNHFIELLTARLGTNHCGQVLDLGCGPGDICRRFARAFTDCRIVGVDASAAMLNLGIDANKAQAMEARIEYVLGYLPQASLPGDDYSLIMSSSLLHHLDKASTLWRSIRHYGQPGTKVFVMDLLRPDSRENAAQLVKQHAAGEAEILKQDFYNSLLAAYNRTEVEQQLQLDNLTELNFEIVSDRHFIVYGQLS